MNRWHFNETRWSATTVKTDLSSMSALSNDESAPAMTCIPSNSSTVRLVGMFKRGQAACIKSDNGAEFGRSEGSRFLATYFPLAALGGHIS